MSKRAFGFDPERLSHPPTGEPVVPRILDDDLRATAKGFTEVRILGVGGGGTNAVNRMIEAEVQGVEFVALNTDAQALGMSHAQCQLLMGHKLTKGLGVGGDPALGEKAAQDSADEIRSVVRGADMVFITAGLGGGTGTGAAPVVAEIAREERALTVGVVTTPFLFEGARRCRVADQGVEMLRERVDALIVVPNERLLSLGGHNMTFVDAFKLADDILRQGVQGISDLVTTTGLINVDFADIRAVMAGAGTAMMAIGEGNGEGRATAAAQAAISSPLLDTSIDGARGVLMNVTGGLDLTLAEVHEAAYAVRELADTEANIIFGTVLVPNAKPEVKITLIATGVQVTPAHARPRSPLTPPSPAAPDASGRLDRPSELDLPAFLRRRR